MRMLTPRQRLAVVIGVVVAVSGYSYLLISAITHHDWSRFIGTNVGLALGVIVFLLIVRRRGLS